MHEWGEVMAKIDGRVLLTEKQIRTLGKGKPVHIKREGREMVIGVKSRVEAKMKVRKQIKALKVKLRGM